MNPLRPPTRRRPTGSRSSPASESGGSRAPAFADSSITSPGATLPAAPPASHSAARATAHRAGVDVRSGDEASGASGATAPAARGATSLAGAHSVLGAALGAGHAAAGLGAGHADAALAAGHDAAVPGAGGARSDAALAPGHAAAQDVAQGADAAALGAGHVAALAAMHGGGHNAILAAALGADHAAVLAAAQAVGQGQAGGHRVDRGGVGVQEDLPSWFQGAATAALGNEWMTQESPMHFGSSQPDSTVNPEVEMPSQPAAQGASVRRKGGRAPRPPPAAARSSDVDLTDTSQADWSDENTRILCDIFAEEVQNGNRSNTHLNKAGYKNVIEKFYQRTGLLYERKQFKNKWDKLKGDYGIWKQLANKETGIGWDASHTNIVMPEPWWKKMANEIKGSYRFRHRGLQNEEKLSIMFEDIRNTGDDHWCASSGVAPSQSDPTHTSSPLINLDEEEEYDNNDDSEPEEMTPTSSRSKRTRAQGQDKGKKPKTSGGQWFQEKMDELVAMNERATVSCESMAASRKDKSDYSIHEVMALVKACGATSGTNEHFIATCLFTRKAEREMFMTLDTPEERFEWLKRKGTYPVQPWHLVQLCNLRF